MARIWPSFCSRRCEVSSAIACVTNPTCVLFLQGYEVHGIIRRSSSFNTGRIDHLYRYGLRFARIRFIS